MISRLADLLAPDHCCGCGFVGDILCPSCKYDITSEAFGRCIVCLKPTARDNLCSKCKVPYSRAWVVGWRSATLEKLVDTSKFDSNRRACQAQADLLDSILPRLPASSAVVPVPTTRPHIRQRGYGHAELIAKWLARRRQIPYLSLLKRTGHSVQHGSSRRERLSQARLAYTVDVELDSKRTYILVDDVYTTGSTARYAAQALRQAGAKDVWLAVTSRQPLD